jgi:NAD(P)-dependent dehydrogenase (short-subunit alcohol dehydrogenase family)
MRLQEKIIAITGASRGPGLALSRAFAAEDAQVAMLARTPAELSAVSQELHGAIAITCDVSKPDDVRMGFGQIPSHFGGLNILVSNAAQGYPQAIEEAHDDFAQTAGRSKSVGATVLYARGRPHHANLWCRRYCEYQLRVGTKSLSVAWVLCCD